MNLAWAGGRVGRPAHNRVQRSLVVGRSPDRPTLDDFDLIAVDEAHNMSASFFERGISKETLNASIQQEWGNGSTRSQVHRECRWRSVRLCVGGGLGYPDTPEGIPRYGIEAVVSHDHGRTWDLDRRYVLDRWDGEWLDRDRGLVRLRAPNETYTVLLPDGTLITAFGTGYLRAF